MRSWLMGAALLGLLAACETDIPDPVFAELRFDHLPSITLDVARIEVVRGYKPSFTKPNVDHLFPVNPLVAAERWGKERLRPAGAAGVAKVTVARASVVEVALARTKGIRGVFTKDQTERYDGVLEMTVQIIDGRGRERGAVTSRVERSKSVAEGISLNERKKVWYDMTVAMLTDMNITLEKQIRDRLKKFVR